MSRRTQAQTSPAAALSESLVSQGTWADGHLSLAQTSAEGWLSVVTLVDLVASRRFGYRLKRLFDVFCATLLLILLSPVFGTICLLLRLSFSGPIFYRQRRLGQHGQEFTMFKFRTMVHGADTILGSVVHLNHAKGPLFKAREDPRVTRVGRLLRRSFLDELPQLVNVLRGDMALVGPRPCLPSEMDSMSRDLPFRFLVPQGMTGPWQANGRHEVGFDEHVAMEYGYIVNWSLRQDILLLTRTIGVVLNRRGM